MQKQLEQYFGCKVKIAEYKNKLQLPIFMTMRDIMMVEIYGVCLSSRKCIKGARKSA
mgnify:CR=1 FL=1